MVKRFYKIVLILSLVAFCNNIEAQEDFDFIKYNPKSKFGLRLGAGISAVRGGNFQKPTPYFGYAAGFYHHGRIKREVISIMSCQRVSRAVTLIPIQIAIPIQS